MLKFLQDYLLTIIKNDQGVHQELHLKGFNESYNECNSKLLGFNWEFIDIVQTFDCIIALQIELFWIKMLKNFE